jgi:hypothetical protein
MGKEKMAEQIELLWPSGAHDILKNLQPNATYVVEEGGKILSTVPFKRT